MKLEWHWVERIPPPRPNGLLYFNEAWSDVTHSYTRATGIRLILIILFFYQDPYITPWEMNRNINKMLCFIM